MKHEKVLSLLKDRQLLQSGPDGREGREITLPRTGNRRAAGNYSPQMSRSLCSASQAAGAARRLRRGVAPTPRFGCYDADTFENRVEIPIHIAAALPEDYEWCAGVMASSEPWITLGRDLAGCGQVLTRPGADLFLARRADTGQRAGFILLAPYGLGGSPYIATFAVAAEARGCGVGSRLLNFAEQRFAGRRHLFLLVSSFNHRAQELYRRHGFECVGELKDYIVAGYSELIFHKGIQ
jgi:ribosomal protein S18 acetylase RimI-like enzyme